MRHLPNLICLLRIALIGPTLVALRAAEYPLALALFIAAAVSDGLDGYLAKRFGWTSDLGRFLDPLADKLLLVALFVQCAWLALVPWWLTAAVVARDVMIGAGALIFRLWFGPLRGRPTADQQGQHGRAAALSDAGAARRQRAAAVARDPRCLCAHRAHHHRNLGRSLPEDLRRARLDAPGAALRGAAMRQLPLGVRLPDRAVFASFLPARNVEALEHARRVAAGEFAGLTWLCGPPGVGKTHLLQAICSAASERLRAGYVPLAEFAPLGIEVLEGLPQLECLCMDDLDAVIGRLEWERAIFALLRELQDAGGRLVLAASAPPALLRWALPDLASRCAAGAVLQLRPLDESEQQAALRLRARVRGFELPEETLQWLQRRFPRDMRSLYELLDTLDEAALAAQRRITIPFIREVLSAPRPR